MKSLLKIIGSLILIFAALLALSGLYEDWLWFNDLGYDNLFWTPFLSKLFIQLINGSILFFLISATLLSGRHAFATFYNEKFRKKIRLVDEINKPLVAINERKVTLMILLISVVISLIVSFIVGFTGWLDVISFFNSSTFNISDPLLGKDLSFYVFKLPFLLTIYNAFFSPVLILTIFTVFFYLITGVIHFSSFRIWKKDAVLVSPRARKHIGTLLAILFALKAFGYYLDTYRLVYSQNGHVIGAGYSDVHASLPALKLLLLLSFFCFILSLCTLAMKDTRLITIPVPLLMLSSIIFYGIFPNIIQSFIVIPNELQKEIPYIENEIRLTRFAYGLDKVEERDYPGNQTVTTSDLKKDIEILKNVRLNDPRPMMKIYTQKQGIRSYYKFNDIDIDRYWVNGEYRQVMLAPREISIGDLDSKANTFINTKLKFTHGFGLTASFANAVTPKGLPSFAVNNIPPQTDYAELRITEPRIYFGELTNDWVVVNTQFKEFDYPLGNDNAENNYQGQTGIVFTPLNKLMLSLHRTTAQFYFAREITAESRILLYRNILERVQKLAPFLKYDSDPYTVIDNGRIKWIIDAYTTASTIPYSSKYHNESYNYIRNSVKAVIDAYDGTVDFYALDAEDPILQTYRQIFPDVFKNLEEMPLSLKAHLRYPETLFKIQSEMLKTFHMTNTKVFYNKEDAWSIAKEIYEANPQNVEPYYVIMTLPGEEKPEFILMQPFTPASSHTNSRNNMISWLSARMDDEHYGKLVLYKLPKNIEIDGPFQIESRIDQDPEISKQLALWNQKGSSVIRGNLMILPIGGNFLFVEPIYLQSTTSGSIPEMTKVIVAFEDKMTMANSFDEGLKEIFGKNAPNVQPPQDFPITSTDKPAQDLTEQEADLMEIIEQIKRMREMLDSLENQLTTLKDSTNLAEDSLPFEDEKENELDSYNDRPYNDRQ